MVSGDAALARVPGLALLLVEARHLKRKQAPNRFIG